MHWLNADKRVVALAVDVDLCALMSVFSSCVEEVAAESSLKNSVDGLAG